MGQVKFRPYRGKDENIKAIPYSEGYVYFATDTGRIYIDYKNERLTMGGNGASLFYANDNDVFIDLLDHYYIDIATLEDPSSAIKPSDLIINSDGSFYKVIEVDLEEQRIECNRIAVSGSGGSGGEEPGGEYTTLDALETVPATFIYGQSYKVKFKATSSTDLYVNINVKVDGINNQTKDYNTMVPSGQEFEIDIGALLFQGQNRIVVTAIADNSGSAMRRFLNREAVILDLKKSEDFNPRLVLEGERSFTYIPVGVLNKKLEVYIDNTLAVTKTIEAAISDTKDTINLPAEFLLHGIHTIKAILSAEVNGVLVTTDPIEYQIASKQTGIEAPLVWTPNGYPNKIIQYEDLIIEYMVWSPLTDKEIETHFYKDGVELDNSPRNLNYDSSFTQKWNITDYAVGINNYTIMVGSSIKSITVEVEKDEKRDLEVRSGGLVLNLESSGRSNDENPTSRATWISKTSAGTAVEFKDFNWYNNGWITDEDGRSCLRISNGASISIPLAGLAGGILNTTRVEQAIGFEFRFKVRNVQEYATLVQTESVEDENGNIIITNTVESEKGVFGKLYGSMGFCLGTQEAFFKSTQTTVHARYREDKIINISFIVDTSSTKMPLLYIYLDGILSGIAKYNPNSDSFVANTTNLVFNSKYCDIDLYNIRIYKGNKLESVDVVHNCIADKKDVKEYDINQITTTSNGVPTIDFIKMLQYNEANPSETIMPYMVLQTKSSDNMLPFVKGGKKAVRVEFHNPALDYAWENGLIDDEAYLHGAPSFYYDSNGKSLDVQGTSSQGYPRRNYKWKAKQDDAIWRYSTGPLKDQPIYEYNADSKKYKGSELNGVEYKKFYLDNSIGESTFCFKADYMESSGTHNTGYASFVNELYSKHPLKDYFPQETLDKSLRTTVYGFPMLIFQQTGANTYDFVGRYNFNFDKAATDVDGFTYDANSYVKNEAGEFLPIEEIAECWEFTNNQGTRCSFRVKDNPFNALAKEVYNEIELTIDSFIPNKYYIRTNTDTHGNHTYELAAEYNANLVYYEKQSGQLDVLNDFEYRYSYFEDEIDAAIDGTDDFAGASQEARNAYLLEKMANFRKVVEWVDSTDAENATNATLDTPVEYEGTTYSTDSASYRKAKFIAEFKNHFDREYCEVYFIMTELLHLYDSRGKNLMLATWGPKEEGKEYIWYPIFYDIDTQLGINNSGVPTWDYYVEPTDSGMFSTSNSLLWNNLWSAFSDSIMSRYIDLRKNALNIAELDGFYNARPIPEYPEIDTWKEILANPEMSEQLKQSIKSCSKIGKRPIMIYNVDQYYKYISPSITGFINTSGLVAYDTGTFFYCLQGSRELMRYLYLRNRLNYLDSKWHAGSYDITGAKQEVWARYDANYGGVTSDSYLVENAENPAGSTRHETAIINGITYEIDWHYVTEEEYPVPLDTIGDFLGVKSYLHQYMSLQLDDRIQDPVRSNGVDKIDLMMPSNIREGVMKTDNFTQQLVYIGGGEYISDLGDLSVKYLDEFHIPTLKRVKNLQIGSDVKGYYNTQLHSGNFDLATNLYTGEGKINQNAKTLLERIILTGLTALDSQMDATACEKLKEFRALNTNISGVSLADGVQIKVLHLPKSITNLRLIEPVELQGIITSVPVIAEDGTAPEGLYIEKLTNPVANFEDNISLITLEIIGGNMKYDSYKLLENAVKYKLHMQGIDNLEGYSKDLAINLKNVNWSPYTVVEFGEPYDESKTYYLDRGRFRLGAYTYAEDTWEDGTRNGNIYSFDAEYFANNQNVLTNLDILKAFVDSYKAAVTDFEITGTLEKNYFKSTSVNATKPTLPEISGVLYVNNTDASEYDEADIQNEYIKYFPNLKFFFKELTPAYVATYISRVNDVDEIIHTERVSSAITDASPTYPDGKIPIRLNHDFLGWSLDGKTPLTKEEIEAIKFADVDGGYLKFYAVFELHQYNISFYNYVDGKEELIITIQVPAGDMLHDPPVLPSVDESNLVDEVRYKHLGYVNDVKYCYPANEAEGKKNLVDLSSILSENMDRKYYACYIQTSVFESATSSEFFNFIPFNYVDDYDSSYNVSGYQIVPKDGVVLSGKITIPATYNGSPINCLGRFNDQEKITHVYFMDQTNIRVLSDTCFSGDANLKIFDFPSRLRKIDNSSFMSCRQLRYNKEKWLNMKVYEIGQSAFNGTFTTEIPFDLFISGEVRTIGHMAFANLAESSDPVIFTSITFGSKENPSKFDPSKTQVDNAIFSQNSQSEDPVKKVIYYSSGEFSFTEEEFVEYVNSPRFLREGHYCNNIEFIN